MYSYIDEEGKNHHKRIRDYQPKLYMKQDGNEEAEFRSIYDYPVKSIQFDDIKGAKKYIEDYKHVDGMRIEGNSKFDNQFVIELFEGETPEYDASLIKGCFLDIEVPAPEFPNPMEAKYPIDLITLYNTHDKTYYCFSLYDYDHTNDDTDAGTVTVRHTKHKNETELLSAFIAHMMKERYHYLSGWNSNDFDITYIVNRITTCLSESSLKNLSPYNSVYTRRGYDAFGNRNMKTYIHGLAQLDYMLLYKKHIYEPRENYKLDYICEVELDKGKLDYSEEGSIYNLARNNPQKYQSYNIIDVMRLVELEEKLQLFPLTFFLTYRSMCNYEDTLGTTAMWESLIAKEFYKRSIVPLAYQENSLFRDFPGGYVANPKVGRHDWILTEDLNSLYPHIQMQVNISPETYVQQKDLPQELIELQNMLRPRDPKLYYIQCQNIVNKEVDLSVLKKYNLSMSPGGQFYRRDKRGLIPIINEELYNDRKAYKKKMMVSKQELVEVKDALKKFGISDDN